MYNEPNAVGVNRTRKISYAGAFVESEMLLNAFRAVQICYMIHLLTLIIAL